MEGDTLLIERVQQENQSSMPARGLSMQEVEAQLGAEPTSSTRAAARSASGRRSTAGPIPPSRSTSRRATSSTPSPIKADANEVGPKPAIRCPDSMSASRLPRNVFPRNGNPSPRC